MAEDRCPKLTTGTGFDFCAWRDRGPLSVMHGLVKGVAEREHTAPAHLNFKADFYLACDGEDFVPAGTQS
jgi:hypothetical protein